MKDVITCFGKTAEMYGWRIIEGGDFRYTVESKFTRCIEPYRFDVFGDGKPVSLGGFADAVCIEYENLDISKSVYSLLDSDGRYKLNPDCQLGDVYQDMMAVRVALIGLHKALVKVYERIKRDAEYEKEPHSLDERCYRALSAVLDDDSLSEGEIVDMMYGLCQNIARYAVIHNKGKRNLTARQLLGGTFSEEVLRIFDQPYQQSDSANSRSNPPEYTVIETCPHCENEIKLFWDVAERGYKAFCPVCGKRLMLCDECLHSGPDGELVDNCDYCSETDSCCHNRPEEKCENKEEG